MQLYNSLALQVEIIRRPFFVNGIKVASTKTRPKYRHTQNFIKFVSQLVRRVVRRHKTNYWWWICSCSSVRRRSRPRDDVALSAWRWPCCVGLDLPQRHTVAQPGAWLSRTWAWPLSCYSSCSDDAPWLCMVYSIYTYGHGDRDHRYSHSHHQF